MFEIANLAKHSQSPPFAILGQNPLQQEWAQVSKLDPTLIQGHSLIPKIPQHLQLNLKKTISSINKYYQDISQVSNEYIHIQS